MRPLGTFFVWFVGVSVAVPLIISCSSSRKAQSCVTIEDCAVGYDDGDDYGPASGTGIGTGTGTGSYSPYDADTTGLVEGQDYVRGTVKDGNGQSIPIVALTARRCEQLGDSLNPQQGLGRIAYTVGPSPYTSSAGCESSSINRTFIRQAAAGAQIQANGGVTPLYPTYGETDASGRPYIMSPPGAAPFSGNNCAPIRISGRRLLAFCIPSCFAPDQKIQVSETGHPNQTVPMTVVDAHQTLEARKQIDPNATLAVQTVDRVDGQGNLRLTLNPAAELITELEVSAGHAHQVDIIEFRTRSQNGDSAAALAVTPNHPVVVLRSDGAYLIPAASATTEDRLLLASGGGDAIVSAVRTKINAGVYSVRMHDTLDLRPNANLIVGGGALDFITGSFGYQQLLANRGIDDGNYVLNNLNRLVLRNSGVPDGLVE